MKNEWWFSKSSSNLYPLVIGTDGWLLLKQQPLLSTTEDVIIYYINLAGCSLVLFYDATTSETVREREEVGEQQEEPGTKQDKK